jgi:hypothetical protein
MRWEQADSSVDIAVKDVESRIGVDGRDLARPTDTPYPIGVLYLRHNVVLNAVVAGLGGVTALLSARRVG